MPVGVDWMMYVEDDGNNDLNEDGTVDIYDCPFPLGTPAAKRWFHEVLDPLVKSTQPTPEMKVMYGDSIKGVYKGKPLVPGVAGPGQGDFQYMVDSIRIKQGLSHQAAKAIAGKVKVMKYGPRPVHGIQYPKGG